MSYRPDLKEALHIGNVNYHVAEHPSAPGMPYGQEGRQAVVYQLVVATGEKRALKIFKPRYQVPALVTLSARLAAFTDLPGLVVCNRTVLTARHHAELLRRYPDLTYAVLMPWIEGPTWMEVLLGRTDLSAGQSLNLARSSAEVLASMEERGVAHCDLSGPNVLLPILAGFTDLSSKSKVELVDVEQLCGPNLDRPTVLPAGSSGYGHHTASAGLWSPDADRFAGALLLAEMLGWCDERVRAAAWGESYFAPDDLQQDSARYRTLSLVLRELWGEEVARLLEQAWNSDTLADCPTFGQWVVLLPERSPVAKGYEVQPTLVGSLAPTPSGAVEQFSVLWSSEIGDRVSGNGPPRYAEPLRAGATRPSEPSESAALPQPPVASGQPEDLARFFDEGLAAYRQGDWARAKELLGEVVRGQPDFKRGKQQAARLLADADKRLTTARSGGSHLWTKLVIPVVLLAALVIFGSIAVAVLQAQDSERQAQAQAHRTATALTILSAQESATAQTQADIRATGTLEATILNEGTKATSTAQAQTTYTAEAVAALETSAARAQTTETAEVVTAAQATGTAQAMAAQATGTAQAMAVEANDTATAQALAANAQTATAEAQAALPNTPVIDAGATAQVRANATGTAQVKAQATAQALLQAKETETAQAQATAQAISEVRQTGTAQALATIQSQQQATSQALNREATAQSLQQSEQATTLALSQAATAQSIQATMEVLNQAATAQAQVNATNTAVSALAQAHSNATATALAQQVFSPDEQEQALVNLINLRRQSMGLASLPTDPSLTRIARRGAEWTSINDVQCTGIERPVPEWMSLEGFEGSVSSSYFCHHPDIPQKILDSALRSTNISATWERADSTSIACGWWPLSPQPANASVFVSCIIAGPCACDSEPTPTN